MSHPFELAEPGPGHPGPPQPGLPKGTEATALEPRWPAWYGPAAFVAALLVGTTLALPISLILEATVGAGSDSPAVNVAGTLILDVALVLSAVLLASRTMRPRLRHFGFRPTRFWPAVGWSALGLLCFYVFAGVYQALMPQKVEQSTLEQLGAGDGTAALIGAGLLIVVVAPVVEETFFRGFFYRALRSRFGTVASALLAGGLFGLIHFGTGWEAIPPIAVLGVAFCLIYERTGSLYTTIALHAVNNAVALGVSPEGTWPVALSILAVMLAACVILPGLSGRPLAARRPATAPG